MALPPYQSVLERFPDHAKAIGMMSIEMANLDIFLGYLFAAILRIPFSVGKELFVTPKSAFARLDLLETAINEVIEDGSKGKKQLKHIHKRAAKIITDRHSLIHDNWGTDTTGQVGRRSTRGVKEITPVPLETLERQIWDIRVLIGDIRTETAKLEHDALKTRST